jgi:ATP-binding cassette subfamily F protein 3
MLLQTNNLLVMDEPTNHLDMLSKDILKTALAQFDGTLILVSHDRDFLDGLVDKVYEFKDHKVREHLGGIYDFLKNKKINSLREIEKKSQFRKAAPSVEENPPDSKADYEKRRLKDKNIRKMENKMMAIEKEIEQMEEEMKRMNALLQSPENITEQALFDQYGKIKEKTEKKMMEWEEIQVEIEKLKDERF